MDPTSEDTAITFCKLCDWVYQSWMMHKCLFDDNKTPDNNIGKSLEFTNRLSIITQEYCLQQIAKLHDPAIQKDRLNLTIDYMIRFGNWGEQAEHIEGLQRKLNGLWECIKPARNKTLAHNDFETLMNDDALGSFPQGEDEKYFAALQALVDDVHEKWVGGPCPFDDLVKNHVVEFLAVLERSRVSDGRGKAK
ncbi:MAG: hypothetical protein HZA24_09145 [Nitrospirae bacterium]|nr:hypothetical protein [Nitrospirota bacterium]